MKQVHALLTPLLHTSTLVLVPLLLALAVLLRPLYDLKVAHTIVKKRKGRISTLPSTYLLASSPFCAPLLDEARHVASNSPCLSCRLRFRRKTMPLLSAESPAHIWDKNTGCFHFSGSQMPTFCGVGYSKSIAKGGRHFSVPRGKENIKWRAIWLHRIRRKNFDFH